MQLKEIIMKKYWNIIVVILLVICVFPVLITFMVVKINGNISNEKKVSGKTIEMECEEYSVTMDMEDFIPCVLMAQMPIDSPIEAMKAQVVVIRTYILHKIKDNEKISTKELGLPFISYSKLKEQWFEDYKINNATSYVGVFGNLTGVGAESIFQENIEYLKMIVDKTDRQVMKYNGELILLVKFCYNTV